MRRDEERGGRHAWRPAAAVAVLLFFILHPSSFILAARYAAVWDDGSRTEGDVLAPWSDTSSAPCLAGRPLFGDSFVRWIQDTTLGPARRPEARVELVGGDVLPGRVVGLRSGGDTASPALPMHFVVAPSPSLDRPSTPPRLGIRVPARWVRRIVLQPVRGDYRPSTLVTREGRQIAFRAVRFGEDTVRLLSDDGLQEVALGEIAELHMPAPDPWAAYVEQLAALLPDVRSRLIRWETADGLRVTGSRARFQASGAGSEENPAGWHHMLQPAWSLDPLWVPFLKIRLREYFAADEVPLSSFTPDEVRQQSDLGGSWRWQADRNVEGGPLASGGRPFPSGFGVHAMTELGFALPEYAVSLRSALGLDALAGDGGCAQAAVLLGEKTLYQSPVIVGSRQVFDTGRLALDSPGGGRRLTLRVDAAHKQRPAGADPLDVRDHFNWLEPHLGLDRTRLAAEVLRRAPQLIPAWSDWTVQTGGKPGASLASGWAVESAERAGYRLMVSASGGPVVLSRGVQPSAANDLLIIAVSRPDDFMPSRIEVRADGKLVGEFDVPATREGTATVPVEVSLTEHRGRRVQLEITQRSASPGAVVDWERVELARRP